MIRIDFRAYGCRLARVVFVLLHRRYCRELGSL